MIKNLDIHVCVEYKMSLRSMLKSKLNRGNLVKVINTYVVSVMSYTEGFVKWTRKQLESLNKITRNQQTLYKYQHLKNNVDMVYVDRNGEDWLVRVEKCSQTGETVMWKTLRNL